MINRLAELREKRANGDKGFTLIELLVVVVIIGILIAIAIPLYLNYRKGANDKATQSDLRGAISALETCMSDTNSYPTGPTGADAFKGTLTDCTSQKVNVSDGSKLTYIPSGTTAGSVTGYILLGHNTNGNNTGGSSGYYCYSSKDSGSVARKTSAEPSTYGTGSCPAS